jgi:hypothetical protein
MTSTLLQRRYVLGILRPWGREGWFRVATSVCVAACTAASVALISVGRERSHILVCTRAKVLPQRGKDGDACLRTCVDIGETGGGCVGVQCRELRRGHA